jgi:hypothetical protein
MDFWRLGAFLLGAALLAVWLAHRQARELTAPPAEKGWRGHLVRFRWQAPYLLLQFFFGGIFSALFILYFKSSGHLGTWLMASVSRHSPGRQRICRKTPWPTFHPDLGFVRAQRNPALQFCLAACHRQPRSPLVLCFHWFGRRIDPWSVAAGAGKAWNDLPRVGIGRCTVAGLEPRHDRTGTSGQAGHGDRTRFPARRRPICSKGGERASLAVLAGSGTRCPPYAGRESVRCFGSVRPTRRHVRPFNTAGTIAKTAVGGTCTGTDFIVLVAENGAFAATRGY